ncbi:hypothetical protein N8647_01415 [bacterium]|nr:hypothetical protein [bacterium]
MRSKCRVWERDETSKDQERLEESFVVVIVSWMFLLLGLGMIPWFFTIRERGSLRYWIRAFEVEEQWVIGNTFDVDAQPILFVFGILLICFLSGACKFFCAR